MEEQSLFPDLDGGSIPTSPLHFSKDSCSKCGSIVKLHWSFGKWLCEVCKNNRPNIGTGNSGMFSIPQLEFCERDGIFLKMVPKSNGMFGHLYFSHYPKSKGIVGRALCYVVYKDRKISGIIGCSSPPINYKLFSEFFGGDKKEKYFVVNNVFRLIDNEKNLATKVLRLFRIIAKQDYKKKYGDDLLGMVTFIEPPRTGTIYKADNWNFIGMTQGKRMRRDPITWEKKFCDGEKKYIYGFKY